MKALKGAHMENDKYEPLHELIQPHIDKRYSELPKEIQARVDEDFPMSWCNLSHQQRYSFAQSHDAQNDPAMKEERQYWRNLEGIISEVESQVAEWESMRHGNDPSKAEIKQRNLIELRAKLNHFIELRTLPPFSELSYPPTVPRTAPVAPATAIQKPFQRGAAQDAAILSEIKFLGLDPLNLPKTAAGKPGMRAAVRASMKSRDESGYTKTFSSNKVYETAWQRLRDGGEMRDAQT